MAGKRHMLRNFFLVIFLGFIFIGAAPTEPVKKRPLGDRGKPKNYKQTVKKQKAVLRGKDMAVGAMPVSFDWSRLGMVTPAKDQGACGSCWAFASTGVFESKLLMMGEPVYDLSEEQQISCNSSMSKCSGGNMNALQFWFNRGPMEESCTGYKSATLAIPPCTELARCGELLYRTYDYYTVNATVNDIKTTIYNDGPAYFRFDVYYDFFAYWDSQAPGAVYVNTTGNLAGGHAVLVIGWDDAKNAWLCKNSWGNTSGPNGNGTFWIAYSGHAHNLYIGVANVKVKYLSVQKADLVSIGAYDAANAGYVYTSLSNGAGFPRWNWNSGVRMIDNNARVFFADANGDKHKDLISIGAYDAGNAGFVYVSLSNGTAYPGWNWNSGGRMIDNNSRVYFADVNGDGKADMVGIGAYDAGNAGFVYVSLSNGSAYPGWSWNSGGRMIDNNSRLYFADVNGDGKTDMIGIGSHDAGNAGFVYVSLSNGSAYPGWSWNSGGRMIDNNSRVYFADVNGDSKADMIGIGAYDAGNAGFVYVSLSNGSAYPGWSWNSGGRMIDNNSRLYFADVNGDGKADMVGIGAYDAGNAGFVYVSLSNGSAFPGWNWNSGGRMIDNNSTVFVEDINADKKADLIGIGAYDLGNAGVVYVSLSNGTGFPGWCWNSGIKIIDRYSRVFVVE